MYYLSKLIKKIKPSAIKNSKIDRKSKIEGGCLVLNSNIGKYSFCGYDCILINTTIGSFTSIASNVKIGLGSHPLKWVSTSPAFYLGRDSIKKDLASKSYDYDSKKSHIGNDVWIGENVLIKDGVNIGDGAVIGMGSVLTKDVPPYEIWAGNPAKFIRKRFDNNIVDELKNSEWWELPDEILKKLAIYIDTPIKFLDEIKKIKNKEVI